MVIRTGGIESLSRAWYGELSRGSGSVEVRLRRRGEGGMELGREGGREGGLLWEMCLKRVVGDCGFFELRSLVEIQVE